MASIRWEIFKFTLSPSCPNCAEFNSQRMLRLSSEKKYKCASCKKRFQLFTGTVFEKTKFTNKEIIEIIDAFIARKSAYEICDPEIEAEELNSSLQKEAKLKLKNSGRYRSVRRFLEKLRKCLIKKLPSEEQEAILNDKIKVFGLIGDKVIPLVEVEEKTIRKACKNESWGELDKYEGFITKSNVYPKYEGAEKNLLGGAIRQATRNEFLERYSACQHHSPQKIKTGNFSLYLKSLEYLFARRKKTPEQVRIDVLREIFD